MRETNGQSVEIVRTRIINKAKYGWTKWGGGNRGLVQSGRGEAWFCQICKQKQAKELDPYMFEFIPREYLNICSKCHHTRLIHSIPPLHWELLRDLIANL